MTVEIDCTKAYKTSKALDTSFFIYYLHKTLTAFRAVMHFRYRISKGQVLIYDRIDASATITKADGSFGFCLIASDSDFDLFSRKANIIIERVKNTPELFTRKF